MTLALRTVLSQRRGAGGVRAGWQETGGSPGGLVCTLHTCEQLCVRPVEACGGVWVRTLGPGQRMWNLALEGGGKGHQALRPGGVGGRFPTFSFHKQGRGVGGWAEAEAARIAAWPAASQWRHCGNQDWGTRETRKLGARVGGKPWEPEASLRLSSRTHPPHPRPLPLLGPGPEEELPSGSPDRSAPPASCLGWAAHRTGGKLTWCAQGWGSTAALGMSWGATKPHPGPAAPSCPPRPPGPTQPSHPLPRSGSLRPHLTSSCGGSLRQCLKRSMSFSESLKGISSPKKGFQRLVGQIKDPFQAGLNHCFHFPNHRTPPLC